MWKRRQVGIGKASASDSLLTCRNNLGDIKTEVYTLSRDKSGKSGDLFVGDFDTTVVYGGAKHRVYG
jgi:hypothetical protein